ncbi:sn-glycerol-3-phosphate ABC transporter ATP-binding protein UgpC [Bacillus sp. NEAU-CP5]|uniref:ABC transporter ATP-binding protein n=1 Tax=Bacillus TaxID=1386 RepID=UPI001C8CA89C|nr:MULTISPECIES: sn-glycerol-3-phosphate ABC transporter ATP-binding protein UgpC [Bacillus]MCX3305691.1 sn-glycerol-3-phosphate ABC transporter ATP-binding protein UgpC [Bacillus velezensis]MCX8440291.1 sn-glycerol-3-phosphate ABC transporter ATP-binding protein UgpC [Bacillus sp. NEAU-CP5]ULH20894.1 sn-glycerol-3-phosphate ABC transporter ATP-binding protein UgpC [Bacillus velezensis]WJF82316.1 sn-glycerol-3-phosphate ABC transporter ATP-binding protein UgpC [Bacillus velezensis]
MASLTFDHIKKTYGAQSAAVKDFHLDVKDEELLVLVGPSGCGKSTTLRMIAGLESISEGKLYIDGDAVNDLPPKDRDIAMVFQNYALYPHMTVFDNMAFGLKLKKLPKKEIAERVRTAADILEIGHLLKRKPKALSGGQRQRVALGRSIVREPKVFLMDEPLSNLDAKLRVMMRAEISKLHQRLKATIVYVTHDQTEAMTMGDRIVVMNEGDIQQAASPHEIYHYPANMFVAGFIGSPSMNFIKGVIEESHGQWYFAGSSVRLPIPKEKAAVLVQKGYSGKEMIAGLRPEHLTLAGQSEHPPEAACRAVAEVCENLGVEMYVHAVSGDDRMTIRLDGASQVKPGDAILLAVNMNRAVFFDADTENAVY